jgi:hypothetical protein
MDEKEHNKKVFYGNDGVRATVIEEDRDPRTEESLQAKTLLRNAARLHQPLGSDYLGSAVVHYFSKPGLMESDKTYFFVCGTSVTEIEEGVADLGWKTLRTALMKAYGREEPKTRN